MTKKTSSHPLGPVNTETHRKLAEENEKKAKDVGYISTSSDYNRKARHENLAREHRNVAAGRKPTEDN